MTDPASVLDAPRRARRRGVLLVVAAVTLLVAVPRSGLADLLGDEQRMRQLVDDLGWVAPFAYTAVFTILIPIGVPGLVLVLPATVVFPAPVAIAVCLVAGYLSSAAGMWFARTVGRETVAARMPARFRAWDERIGERGLVAVIVLRIVTYLAAPADWLLGLSSIDNRTLAVGTGIGLVPPTLLYVIVGGGVLDLLF